MNSTYRFHKIYNIQIKIYLTFSRRIEDVEERALDILRPRKLNEGPWSQHKLNYRCYSYEYLISYIIELNSKLL